MFYLHHCVLTLDPMPIAEDRNQHTVYHSVSCSKLQFSELIKFFCISRSYFILKMIQKMISLNFAGLLQHSTQFFMASPARHVTFNTMAGGQHFVNSEPPQKLVILRAIWTQIRSSMYLFWNYISFYQL